MTAHHVCDIRDLADTSSRAFTIGGGDWPLRGFVVKHGERVFAYVNTCPHAGHSLNWKPHEFLTLDRAFIQCASHGALFEIDSGRCVAGPCTGRSLRALVTRIENDRVFVELE